MLDNPWLQPENLTDDGNGGDGLFWVDGGDTTNFWGQLLNFTKNILQQITN